MKALLKLSVFLLFFILPISNAAQDYSSPQPDEGMDIFLLIIGSIFICAMIGASIVGAFLAALVILLFFSLSALGMLSASLAIGLYKRSFSAGFKSLFLIFFGITSAVLGTGGLLLFNMFIPLHLSGNYLAFIGFSGGLAGGLLLGRILFYIVKELIATLAKRLKPA
ncbi:MAG TPA: hypothetical protein VGN63_24310 [Flavisolibacter sp.]|jgi:hypothetical protein|nr:hypothetical protein [Flavisolibacter sp.]